MITIIDRTSAWAVIFVPKEDVPVVKPIVPTINSKESSFYMDRKGKIVAYQVRIKSDVFDRLKEALGEAMFKKA